MEKTWKIIWLDDMRNPFVTVKDNLSWVEYITGINPSKIESIVWVTNYEDFVKEIMDNLHLPDIICFDHDLGEGESGYDALKWLVDYCLRGNIPLPRCYSQSSNPVGRKSILELAENFTKFQGL